MICDKRKKKQWILHNCGNTTEANYTTTIYQKKIIIFTQGEKPPSLSSFRKALTREIHNGLIDSGKGQLSTTGCTKKTPPYKGVNCSWHCYSCDDPKGCCPYFLFFFLFLSSSPGIVLSHCRPNVSHLGSCDKKNRGCYLLIVVYNQTKIIFQT